MPMEKPLSNRVSSRDGDFVMRQAKKSQFVTHRKSPEQDKTLSGTEMIVCGVDHVSKEGTGFIDSHGSNMAMGEGGLYNNVPFIHSQIKRFTVADIKN
jgi:hypothetical protein